ncbi:MAG TPA: response regulator [Xanthobacteraceae bacterium]|nr:response regulator [Xanthobacteraceae bacterium]
MPVVTGQAEPKFAARRSVGVSTTNTTLTHDADTREVVLVVVSEVLIRMVIADYLRQCGYKVLEAASADEAITILENTESGVDTLFSGLELDDAREGFTLTQWARAHRPQMEIIRAGSLTRAADSAGDLCEQGPHKKKPYDSISIVAQVSQLFAAARRGRQRPPE